MSPEYDYAVQYRDGDSSSSARGIIKIKISKIQADGFRTLSWLSSGKVLLKVQIQDDVRETVVETVESDRAIWDDELHFDTRKGSDMTFTILMRHRMRKETTIGGVTEKLNSCLWNTNSVERRLCHDRIAVHTHIHFKIELLPPASPNAARRQAAFKERISNLDDRHIEGSVRPISNIIFGAVHLATNDVYPRSSSPTNDSDRSVARIASAAEALQLGGIPFAETWDPLLSQVKQFTNLVQKFAEVHPYAKFGFSVLTAAFRVSTITIQFYQPLIQFRTRS
ncbi:WD-REPEATS-REGION domain-containing protein [Mycena venus]|uniref:WD-REPEATS-REGION domain-containing protein n=1 Tax=Mycena venus TaxID=2733690 RepID=A0A8H6YCM7_9AGAR|nr:WD-REPEATS-REGION domain-containing protein [Mycena venus]